MPTQNQPLHGPFDLACRQFMRGLGWVAALILALVIICACLGITGCATDPSTTITGPATELRRDVQEEGPSTETIITVGVPAK